LGSRQLACQHMPIILSTISNNARIQTQHPATPVVHPLGTKSHLSRCQTYCGAHCPHPVRHCVF
jgi:hypothetical protein